MPGSVAGEMATSTGMTERHMIGIEDFSATVGEPLDRLHERVRRMLGVLNGGYRETTPQEREQAVLAVLKRLHIDRLARNVEENHRAFEQGWTENLELCRTEGVSEATLRPKYVRAFTTIRYGGRYIVPDNPYLTDELWTLAMTWAFLKYLAPVNRIYEFGTGTGRYLYLLSQIFPDKELIGLDWTAASVAILELIAKATAHPIRGLRFDMLEPGSDVRVEPDSGVFTVGSMEQLGDRFEPFFRYLLEEKPRIVVHFEPIIEFYREDSLFDYLAILYHRQRNYLHGFYPALRDLSAEGRIEVLEARRMYYGDLYNEGSSLVVWRPR